MCSSDGRLHQGQRLWLRPVGDSITRLKEEMVSPAAYKSFVESNEVEDEELQQRRLDLARRRLRKRTAKYAIAPAP